MHRIFPLTLSMFMLGSTLAAAELYENPVRALDLPDPSLIRTGNGYWATATSSEWAPHFPLLFSRDLVNWEPRGAVFPDTPAWVKGSLWAPEITEDRGTYFVYYTARRHDGRLAVAVATAARPEGPYTDHGELVAQEMGSIDAMAYTDAEGHRWLLWKEDGNSRQKPTPILLQLLSEDGLKLVGERREILTNDVPWEGGVVEGPFVLRHGDYYYLFYSGARCCGRTCNYALGVARAKRMEGPWEKCPANPLLAENEAWRCPGHGSIVRDDDRRYWLLYHAYAREGFVATGRQMLLDEVIFGPDGWPSINGGKGPSSQARAPAGAAAQRDSRNWVETFDAIKTLPPGWQWPIRRKPEMRLENGWLRLTASAFPAVLAQTARSPRFEVETVVEVPATGAAGLAVIGNESNSLALLADSGRVRLILRQQSEDKEIAALPLPEAKHVGLRITSTDGGRLRFAFHAGSGGWRKVPDEADGHFLAPWERVIRLGLMVVGPSGSTAKFDYFKATNSSARSLQPAEIPRR